MRWLRFIRIIILHVHVWFIYMLSVPSTSNCTTGTAFCCHINPLLINHSHENRHLYLRVCTVNELKNISFTSISLLRAHSHHRLKTQHRVRTCELTTRDFSSRNCRPFNVRTRRRRIRDFVASARFNGLICTHVFVITVAAAVLRYALWIACAHVKCDLDRSSRHGRSVHKCSS